MNGTEQPPQGTLGFLWFLRVVAIMALPLYAMAHAVAIGAEIAILVLVIACATGGLLIARRVSFGGFHFGLVGAICGAEALLIVYALAR